MQVTEKARGKAAIVVMDIMGRKRFNEREIMIQISWEIKKHGPLSYQQGSSRQVWRDNESRDGCSESWGVSEKRRQQDFLPIISRDLTENGRKEWSNWGG